MNQDKRAPFPPRSGPGPGLAAPGRSPVPALPDWLQHVAATCQVPTALFCPLAEGTPRDPVRQGQALEVEAWLAPLARRTLAHRELLAIPDLHLDDAFAAWPTAPRFYAGAAVRDPDGDVQALLMLFDTQPRHLGRAQARQLQAFAREAATYLAPRDDAPPPTFVDSPALSHRLLDAISEGLCAMDRQGRVVFCNQAFVHLLGLPDKREALGRSLNELLSAGHPQRCGTDCPIEQAARAGERACAACELFRREDDRCLPVEYRVAPILADGQLQGAICTFTDITERTRTETRRALLLALSDRLQHSVERIDFAELLDTRLARLLEVDRLAYGYLAPGRDEIRLLHEWHAEGLAGALGLHRLDGQGAALAQQLESGSPLRLPSAVGGLPGALGCTNLLLVPLIASEHCVLVLGRSLRPWSEDDLTLVREVRDRIRAAKQRVLATAALREAEQRVCLANEIAAIGVWEYDPASNQLHWDARIKALAGLAADEPVPDVRELLQRVHPEDRVPLLHAFRHALRPDSDGELRLDYRILDRQRGRYLWLANRGRRIVNQYGDSCLLGITREITAERQAADRLRQINALLHQQIEERRQAERRQAAYIELGDLLRTPLDRNRLGEETVRILGTTLGCSRVLMLGLAGQGAPARVRHAWPEVPSGCSGELSADAYDGLLGRLVDGAGTVVDDVMTDTRTAGAADYFRTLGARSLLSVPRREHGVVSCLLVLLQAQPHPWSDDEVSFARDIAERAWSADERMQAEQALRDLNESLERRVGERTRELAEANRRLQVEMQERERAEEALRHAQKMEAIGQLTGGLAHDFNNMLTGVLGALDLLQRRLGDLLPQYERYIDAAVTSANRAAALTHRLLAFARRQTLDPQPVDVNQLVLSMEDMLRRTIGEHIRLKTHLQADLWLAYTDAHQLENALLNLVINARDAMPHGGRLTIETRRATLRARAAEGLPAGDYVQLSVCDSGCGMPREVIEKAFDPFFTTKPIGQGTGLGLSMVYGFVRQTGGQVGIDSQPGVGTHVRLLLPRNHESPAPGQPAADAGEAPRAQAGETVLVVEDEAAVRMLVVEVLRELGYTALEAIDADSALPFLDDARRIDLLVADVGLPGTNGRQLAEMARQRRPGLKILFITGYVADAKVRGEALDEGMEMLGKPFSIDRLAVKIRQMIEDRTANTGRRPRS